MTALLHKELDTVPRTYLFSFARVPLVFPLDATPADRTVGEPVHHPRMTRNTTLYNGVGKGRDETGGGIHFRNSTKG